MLTENIKAAIDRSVLCWLATVDAEGWPNVSPKELFTYTAQHELVIAQIASPQSVRNIRQHNQVCVSFVDVFVQKGYKIKGTARLVDVGMPDFTRLAARLQQMAGAAFPFRQLVLIRPVQTVPIVAPRYQFYPDTREDEQIASALRSYRVAELMKLHKDQ